MFCFGNPAIFVGAIFVYFIYAENIFYNANYIVSIAWVFKLSSAIGYNMNRYVSTA